jgi:hypothetical protein
MLAIPSSRTTIESALAVALMFTNVLVSVPLTAVPVTLARSSPLITVESALAVAVIVPKLQTTEVPLIGAATLPGKLDKGSVPLAGRLLGSTQDAFSAKPGAGNPKELLQSISSSEETQGGTALTSMSSSKKVSCDGATFGQKL